MIQRFTSLHDVNSFIAGEVDKPILTSVEQIGADMTLRKTTMELGGAAFTNVYDIAFKGGAVQPEIVAFDRLTSVYDYIFHSDFRRHRVATCGGFFFLADKASGSPRQLALNLSISRGNIRSLPVIDRESVFVGSNGLEVRSIAALGLASLNGQEVQWSGSMTDYDTQLKVYGNGNTVINHGLDAITGSYRILDESSRYTPSTIHEDFTDVGFVGRGGNEFVGVSGSREGNVDIFSHDFVMRCPQRYLGDNNKLQVLTIGGHTTSRFEGGGFSAGPALDTADFQSHPINRDKSLGDHPPFVDSRLARTVLYKDGLDGQTHIRLFDGRPGSTSFVGITPREAVSSILTESEIEWGCFLDPGQTAKLCVKYDEATTRSYGNRHYLQWPNEKNPDFIWIPNAGRPVANLIAL